MDQLNIVIVDDHALLGEGLKHLLSRQQEFRVLAVVNDYQKLFSLCEKGNVDIILMDMQLGKGSGIEFTKNILPIFPALKIIGFSAHALPGYVQKMMEHGAMGYLLKETDLEEMTIAIRRVKKGKTYFSNEIATALMQLGKEAKQKVMNPIKLLTSREQQILQYVVEEELTNKDIAERLFISPRTVETHKRNLIQKLDVRNIIGLAKYYFNYLQKEKIA